MCYASAMRLTFLTLASLLTLTACPGKPEAGTDSATDPATGTTTATTGASTSGTGTTTTATTANMPTTGTPGTTTGTTTNVVTTGVATTTGTTTASTTGTTSDTTTGESTDTGGAGLCDDDADCKLADDCCACDGVPIDVEVSVCDLDCKQSKCSELGIKSAVCRFGVCISERLSCDASKVACDEAPPPCEPGTLPETTPACWSGRCIPAEHCDVVGSCNHCPDDRVCVQYIAAGPQPGVTCEILPPGCDPAAPCDCLGVQVCSVDFMACFNQQGGNITCECINC